jgi:hypothetical protein
MSNYSRKEKGFHSTIPSRSNVNYENLHRRKPTSDDLKNSVKTNNIVKYNSVIRANRSSTFQNAEINEPKDQHPKTALK